MDKNVLSLMGSMYSGSTSDTDNGMDLMSTCSNPVDAKDKCDAAAAILQCSMDKNPEITNDLIRAIGDSPQQEKAPLKSFVAECPPFECKLNAIRRQEYLTKTTSMPDQYYFECFGQRYILFHTTYNYYQAAAACCEYGLQMITLDSAEEVQCMGNMTTYLLYPTEPSKSMWMWSSGSFANYPATPVWCSTNTPIKNPGSLKWFFDYQGVTGPQNYTLETMVTFSSDVSAGAKIQLSLPTAYADTICKP